jgi:hypothetical protein
MRDVLQGKEDRSSVPIFKDTEYPLPKIDELMN